MFTVTVGLKPNDHPFYEKGSKYCFYINNTPAYQLNLIPGTNYTFNINTPGHPFYFTTSEIGGSEDKNILGQGGFNPSDQFPPTDKGIVKFIMSGEYPQSFYYQCKIHPYMGGVAIRGHNTFYVSSILSGLVAPTSLSSPMGDTQNIYIADQIGLVYKLNLPTQIISIFLDVREYIPQLDPNYDERGLLGLCFHPDFMINGRFFIYYSSVRARNIYQNTTDETGYYNCLSEFTYQGDKILYEAEKVLIRINRDLTFHNGGKIEFGSDGYLYISVGDGGPQKDPQGHAQNLGTLLGKILRIDVNNVNVMPYYGIPNDNPFINVNGALPEIWAYGFRNPWGLDFIPNMDSLLIVTDAGKSSEAPSTGRASGSFGNDSGSGQEKVNVVVKGGNFGWNIKEGSRLAPWAPKNVNISNMIDPIFSYTTSDPNYSDSDVSVIIGGYFTETGDGNTDYICADYSGRLIRLRFTQTGVKVIETASMGKLIRSFGKSSNYRTNLSMMHLGNLYILTSDNTGPSGNTGEVYSLTVI